MLQRNVLLSDYSNYKIGGRAKYFFEAKSLRELEKFLETSGASKKPVFILGGGTNILFSDQGFDGLVIKISLDYLQLNQNILIVGAGVLIEDLLDYCVEYDLGGLEWAGGLPGTVGGAVRGNAGAFKGEIKDNIIEVISLDISRKEPKIVKRTNKQCQFNYRHSIFKEQNDQEIIIEVIFDLKPNTGQNLRQSIEDKIKWREAKQPLEYPNVGSTFKNVDFNKILPRYRDIVAPRVKTDPFPVVPAAFLLAQSNLKGIKHGGAMISPKHPNFIVNVSQAKADDVKWLIALAKREVYKNFQIDLEEEILII